MRTYPLLFSASLFVACVKADRVDPILAFESAIHPTFSIRGESVPLIPLLDRMDSLNVPGVSVAVMIDGELAWARGYGLADVEHNTPVTPNTLFQAASISKPVAALAALKLVDDGRVGLDDNVNNYLRSWSVPDNEFTTDSKVTLRGMLTHRAGLTVWGFPGYGPSDSVPETTGVLEGLGNTDPVRVYKIPGVSWRYSGGGYTVMQQLIEDVYGLPFADVMREEVLTPIGMTRSTYQQPIPDNRRGEVATGYRGDGTPVDGGWHTYPERAAAGLWTTPSELALYARELQQSYHGQSNRLLSQSLTRKMLTPDPDDWGLGPSMMDDGVRFGHGGSNEGFRSAFTAFVEGGDGVFVMTNSDTGSRLAEEIAITIANQYGWPGPRAEEKVPTDLDEEILSDLGGTYTAAEMGLTFRVSVRDSGLHVSWSSGEATLRPMSDSTFFDPRDGRDVLFSRSGDDQALVLGGLRAIRQDN